MNAVFAYFWDILSGAWSLVAGMGVTLRYMFKPTVTVQYPRHRLELPEAYRGHIELVTYSDLHSHHCVACGLCFRICPSNVIKVQGFKERASDLNRARFFMIDFSRCSLCGLCVEVCPVNALKLSKVYDQSGRSRFSAVIDLIEFQKRSEG
ncbi:MAG: NADH-quinone oxidoreductase subunit I [Deltaproteobacteria bacterium]|nr:NADH-quinone oxidoreductase subunit I [Deltaproteobacteria bacterium]